MLLRAAPALLGRLPSLLVLLVLQLTTCVTEQQRTLSGACRTKVRVVTRLHVEGDVQPPAGDNIERTRQIIEGKQEHRYAHLVSGIKIVDVRRRKVCGNMWDVEVDIALVEMAADGTPGQTFQQSHPGRHSRASRSASGRQDGRLGFREPPEMATHAAFRASFRDP